MDGEDYPSVEHAYQAAKTLDLEERRSFQVGEGYHSDVDWEDDARRAKRAGRSVTLRPDWDSVKLGVMTSLVVQKFKYEDMMNKLMDTGIVHIQEGNYWGDTFWGVCRGDGTNHLGRIIMEIRRVKREELYGVEIAPEPIQPFMLIDDDGEIPF